MTRRALVLALALWSPALAEAREPAGESTFWSDLTHPTAPRARALSRRGELRLFASRESPPLLRAEWVRAAHRELNRAALLAPDDLEIAFLRARAAAEEALLPSTRSPRSMILLALSRFSDVRARDPSYREESVAFELAILHTRLRDHARAADEYRRARAALLDPRRGATLVANLAEITMLSGDLERAAAYFDEAITMAERAPDGELSLVLALVGGAVAYDRLGDGARALELQRRARSIEGGKVRATRAAGVFYEPEEELHYYDALDALAWAEETAGEEAVHALRDAERSLLRFLELGESSSLFAARARQRLLDVRVRLRDTAEKRRRPR